MPPTRSFTPKSLEKICLNQVVIYFGKEIGFCSQVRRYEKESLLLRRRGIRAQALEKETESRLDILPPLLNDMVRQHITNEVMKAHPKSFLSLQEIYIGLLNIVLNKDIKVIEFGEHRRSFEYAIWSIIVNRCTGLKRLALYPENNDDGEEYRSHKQRYLRNVIVNCPSLVELVLKNALVGYETLSIIGKHCPVLRLLDITGSLVNCNDLTHLLLLNTHQIKYFNIDAYLDDTLQEPCNPLCQTLRVLILTDTNVRKRGGALAIKTIPNLLTLGNFINLPASLKRVYGRTKPKVPRQITQAFFYGPSHSQLRVLINCCPNMESLHITGDKLRQISPSCLLYKNLRSLTLENVEFSAFISCESVLAQITELKLSTSGTDVGLLGRYCPNLEKLWLCWAPAAVPSRHPNYVPFSKLKKLKIQCTASVNCVGYVVKHAHNIRVIDLLRVEDIDDFIFTEWFHWNSFSHLETLMIRYADLTRPSVDKLLTHCPKLTQLGELGGWDVRSWECKRLKDLVIKENYNLHLVVCSQKADSIIIDILEENMNSEDEMV